MAQTFEITRELVIKRFETLNTKGRIVGSPTKIQAVVTAITSYYNEKAGKETKIINIEATTQWRVEQARQFVEVENWEKAYNMLSTSLTIFQKDDGTFPELPAPKETINVIFGEYVSNGETILGPVSWSALPAAKPVKLDVNFLFSKESGKLENNKDFEGDIFSNKKVITTKSPI